MGLPYPPQYRGLEGLLFVTMETALAKLGEPDYGAESVDRFLGIVDDDYLLYVDGDPVDFGKIRARLNRAPAVKGVVILGDYLTLPPRRVRVISLAEQLDPAIDHEYGDPDSWIVWSDDRYGDANGNMVANKPVSRLPVVPRIGGILGDERRNPNLDIPAVNGVRSFEFDFADAPFFDFLKPGEHGTMPMTPPKRAVSPGAAGGSDDFDSGGDIAADRLYLPLHSRSLPNSTFEGGGIDAITLEILATAWETRGVTFAGACWGALIGTPASLVDQPAVARSVTESIGLSFVDHGATAFVGFNALHYVPKDGWPRGGALHGAFWKNVVVRTWSPAHALHEARLRFMATSGQRNPNAYLRAIDKKTFWSATCLGLGW